MKALMSLTAAAVVTLASAASVAAQGPGSSARFAGQFGGPLMVDASYYDAGGCHAILDSFPGAPPGSVLSHEILPATVVVGPDPLGCSGNPVAREVFGLAPGQTHNLVEIFFVSPDGRLLKTEKVAIQHN